MLPALFRYCETRVESLALTQLLETTLEALRAAGEGGDDVVRAILLTATGAYFRNVYPARFESYGMIVPAHEEAVREAWALAQQAGGLNSVYWNALLGYIYGRIVDRDAGLRYVRGLLPGLTREQAPWQRAFALHLLALLLMLQTPEMEEEDAAEAQAALEEALALFEMGGDLRETGHSRRALGQLHRLKREFSQAIGCWMLARSQLEAAGESAIAGDIYMQIGDAYLQLGQIEEAFPHYRRMSEAHLRSGNERMAAMVLSKESYEAARFGNLEHARQTREQALALAQRTGDLFTEAWCRWEMGELLRLSGEPAQARDWYEQSRALFEQFGDKAGIAFYYRGLGDLALGAGDYEEAAQAFARSVARVQTSANAWAMAYALAGSGIAALKLQQPDEARRHLAGALQSVQEAGDAGIALRVLAAAALLCDALGRRDLAAETSALVWRHPIAWVESKAMVAALHQANEQAGAHAPDPLTDTGVERRQQDLWQMVERVSRALA